MLGNLRKQIFEIIERFQAIRLCSFCDTVDNCWTIDDYSGSFWANLSGPWDDRTGGSCLTVIFHYWFYWTYRSSPSLKILLVSFVVVDCGERFWFPAYGMSSRAVKFFWITSSIFCFFRNSCFSWTVVVCSVSRFSIRFWIFSELGILVTPRLQIPAHLTTHSAKSWSVFPDVTERVSASADQ